MIVERREAGRAHFRERGVEVVVGAAHLGLAAVDEHPERAPAPFVRKTDAAGVRVAEAVADRAHELPVRVTADDERLGDVGKHAREHRIWRRRGEDLILVPG